MAQYETGSRWKALSPRIALGLSEDLIGEIGSDWDTKLFALVRLDHEQDPKNHFYKLQEAKQGNSRREA